MRKLILIASCAIMASCAHTPQISCYQSVAVATSSLEVAYDSTNELLKGDIISVDVAEDALIKLDGVDALVSQAKPLCGYAADEAADLVNQALDALEHVQAFIRESRV